LDEEENFLEFTSAHKVKLIQRKAKKRARSIMDMRKHRAKYKNDPVYQLHKKEMNHILYQSKKETYIEQSSNRLKRLKNDPTAHAEFLEKKRVWYWNNREKMRAMQNERNRDPAIREKMRQS
jgi:hypothetical protein